MLVLGTTRLAKRQLSQFAKALLMAQVCDSGSVDGKNGKGMNGRSVAQPSEKESIKIPLRFSFLPDSKRKLKQRGWRGYLF